MSQPVSSRPNAKPAPVTICVLTYGEHVELVRRCIESILSHCDRDSFRLMLGANAPSKETRRYLGNLFVMGVLDTLITSPVNLTKLPMMREMFALVETELVWWFDDDSFVTSPGTLQQWLNIALKAPECEVQWGHQFFISERPDFSDQLDAVDFVKQAPWYRGLPPPAWEPGGKGETNFEGRGSGDGRWFFVTGGCWMMRNNAIQASGWPDPRMLKRMDDVLLGEVIRQFGWSVRDIGPLGVEVSAAPRRGSEEYEQASKFQFDNPHSARSTCEVRVRFEPEPTRPVL